MTNHPIPQVNSEDQVFKTLNGSDLLFDGYTFTGCTFENCNFTQSSWKRARLCDCTFKGSNLSLVNLEDARLQDIRFEECKIVGANFFKTDKQFFAVHFLQSLLLHCNFADLKMPGTTFENCRVKECYFTNTDLKGAGFSHADCSGTLFHHCNLEKADFRQATQYAIDPFHNKLKGARFSYPDVATLLDYLEIIIE